MNYGYYNPYGMQQMYGQPQDQLSQLRQGYQSQQIQQPQQPQDERIWVQGKGSAEAYLVAPNSFVRLWDSTANVFYEKRSDGVGRPYMETYQYKKLGTVSPVSATQDTEGINAYIERIKALEKRIEALEGGMRNVPESNSNDATIQPV